MIGKNAAEEMQRLYRKDHPKKIGVRGSVVKKAKYLGVKQSIEWSNRPEVNARITQAKAN